MPRYYNAGIKAIDPKKYFPESFETEEVTDELKKERDAVRNMVMKMHPVTTPHRDQLVSKKEIKRPAMWCHRDHQDNPVPAVDAWVPGSECLNLVGYGHWIIPPGESVLLDPSIPEKVIKAHAPHLVNEQEWEEINAKAVPTPTIKNKSNKE